MSHRDRALHLGATAFLPILATGGILAAAILLPWFAPALLDETVDFELSLSALEEVEGASQRRRHVPFIVFPECLYFYIDICKYICTISPWLLMT